MVVTMDDLIAALLDGNQVKAVAAALCLRDNAGSERVVIDGVEEAMGRLDAKCTVDEFNLLEIMLVGRAAMSVIKALYPDVPPAATRETVALASLEGDVHDLGKNIVKTILSAKGYRVVDCGKDCPVEKLVDEAAREGAAFLFVSGLITSVVPLVRRIAPLVRARGLPQVKILAGGAALKQASAQMLNVDFVAESVFDGIHYLEQSSGGRR